MDLANEESSDGHSVLDIGRASTSGSDYNVSSDEDMSSDEDTSSEKETSSAKDMLDISGRSTSGGDCYVFSEEDMSNNEDTSSAEDTSRIERTVRAKRRKLKHLQSRRLAKRPGSRKAVLSIEASSRGDLSLPQLSSIHYDQSKRYDEERLLEEAEDNETSEEEKSAESESDASADSHLGCPKLTRCLICPIAHCVSTVKRKVFSQGSLRKHLSTHLDSQGSSKRYTAAADVQENYTEGHRARATYHYTRRLRGWLSDMSDSADGKQGSRIRKSCIGLITP